MRYIKSILRSIKARNFILVIFFGAIGFFLGPKELAVGNYIAQIEILIDGHRLVVDYPFIIDFSPGTPTIYSKNLKGYQIIISGKDIYRVGLIDSINYKLQVLDTSSNLVQPCFFSSQPCG